LLPRLGGTRRDHLRLRRRGLLLALRCLETSLGCFHRAIVLT
jgi:hypothetical protein